jgi:hypothetical protein
MSEVRAHLDIRHRYEADSPVFHVPENHQTDFMLDLKRQSLWSS